MEENKILKDVKKLKAVTSFLKEHNLDESFVDENALMTAVESRSTSPIRIVRNEQFESVNVSNLYPIGEGAGYAGGIVSAAIDGLKVANAWMKKRGVK